MDDHDTQAWKGAASRVEGSESGVERGEMQWSRNRRHGLNRHLGIDSIVSRDNQAMLNASMYINRPLWRVCDIMRLGSLVRRQ